MPAARRWFLLVCGLALAFAGCTSGKNVASPAPSEQPTATASQSVTDFQLVGTAQHAFVGIGPGFDTSAQSTDVQATPLATAASGTTFGNAGQPGVMRILLDDASDSLKSSCSADRDETIDVFWTTGTQFDQSLLTANLESSLEGRTLGVVGRLFTSPSGSDVIGEATPAPTSDASATPGATANPSCVLVADQIGTSSGTIPTAVPRRGALRTVAPTARATVSPTPKATASPTPAPTPTSTVAVIPTPTAT